MKKTLFTLLTLLFLIPPFVIAQSRRNQTSQRPLPYWDSALGLRCTCNRYIKTNTSDYKEGVGLITSFGTCECGARWMMVKDRIFSYEQLRPHKCIYGKCVIFSQKDNVATIKRSRKCALEAVFKFCVYDRNTRLLKKEYTKKLPFAQPEGSWIVGDDDSLSIKGLKHPEKSAFVF